MKIAFPERLWILLRTMCTAGILLAGCVAPPAGMPEQVVASPTTAISPTFESSATLVAPSDTPAAVATQTLQPTPSATPVPTRAFYIQGPYQFDTGINPLTGLPASDPALLERRPIVVKVTNYPRSVRPQWGLTAADHVYEYYIADELSRFIAVIYGNEAERAGPVRSARIFDAHVMRMYDGIFVFGYADDPVLEFFMQPDTRPRLIVERPDNCPPLCRIGEDDAYNNLFVNTTQVAAYLADRRTSNKRPNLQGLRFDSDVPKSGNPGQRISVQYSLVSYSQWEYDPVTGRYLRYQDTADDRGEKSYAPLMDSLSGAQISANNIIVLFVRHEYFLQSSSTEIIDQPLTGSGRGFAFRDGQLYPIEWVHDSPTRLLTLSLPNGRFYPLKPGVTWFVVMGETSSLEQLPDGEWNFSFAIP